ncbi:MAG: hypothetical protein BWZ02_03073 [Lentisphaerae bacterium ADurb.BinA184]|nr:MAG: hypothetical protein BWZ02_03073 [Lentisphaerae bacterium ADurb.BinA184]
MPAMKKPSTMKAPGANFMSMNCSVQAGISLTSKRVPPARNSRTPPRAMSVTMNPRPMPRPSIADGRTRFLQA